MQIRQLVTASVALVLGGALVSCAAEVVSPSTDASPDESQVAQDQPAKGPAEGLEPAGFPEGFDCESLTDLIPNFTQGLYLNGAHVESDSQITCAWSNVPSDSLMTFQDTELDVMVIIDFEKNASRERVEAYCNGPGLRTTPTALEILSGNDGCGGGSFTEEKQKDSGLWASVPYFDLSLSTGCEFFIECTPTLPAGFTDEAGYEALSTIADRLAAGLEFIEPVIVSDAETGSEFIRDWADAGFPSESDTPEWYCDSYLSSNESYEGVRWASDKDWDWTVSHERVDNNAIFPQYRLEFIGNGNGEAASYRISLIEARCIEDISIEGP